MSTNFLNKAKVTSPCRGILCFLTALLTWLTPVASHAASAEKSLVVPVNGPPSLPAAAPYKPEGDTITVELSQYAGYAGLVLANRGLEPNEASLFYKRYGFKVRFTLNEEESWPALNTGKLAASATTVDVLAAYGKQFAVVVPAMISFSRGADGVVMRSDLKEIRDLIGKSVVVAKFTESDFFMRYLAIKNGLQIHMRSSMADSPDPGKINLLFTEKVDAATEVFADALKQGKKDPAACVGWAPITTDAVTRSKGKAYLKTTNRNQLIIADILVLNRGFAEANPKMVEGLVYGLIAGNQMASEIKNGKGSTADLDLLCKAFTTDPKDPYDRASMLEELGKVDLANLPLNVAFFADKMPQGGSFAGLIEEAERCYGPALVPAPVPAEEFHSNAALDALTASGEFSSQRLTIDAIPGPSSKKLVSVVRKNVRFQFDEAVYSRLDPAMGENGTNLESIASFAKVSPGSVVKLLGHLDNTKAREQGSAWAKANEARAIKASLERAATVKKMLIDSYGLRDDQIETVGKGWSEPLGVEPEQNRRVEVQIFSLE